MIRLLLLVVCPTSVMVYPWSRFRCKVDLFSFPFSLREKQNKLLYFSFWKPELNPFR